MAKAYLYEFKLDEGATYFVYSESRVAAEESIKEDLGTSVKYEFVERKPF